MALWDRIRKIKAPAVTGQVQKPKKTVKRAPPVAMEVKLLALEGLEAGLSAEEVGELAGVSGTTVQKWRSQYAEGGVQGRAQACWPRAECGFPKDRRPSAQGVGACSPSPAPQIEPRHHGYKRDI